MLPHRKTGVAVWESTRGILSILRHLILSMATQYIANPPTWNGRGFGFCLAFIGGSSWLILVWSRLALAMALLWPLTVHTEGVFSNERGSLMKKQRCLDFPSVLLFSLYLALNTNVHDTYLLPLFSPFLIYLPPFGSYLIVSRGGLWVTCMYDSTLYLYLLGSPMAWRVSFSFSLTSTSTELLL